MKLLTFAIPCYNSAAYMEKCIDSLLPGGEDVEIIIVNDGSTKDNTAEIADAYAEKYGDKAVRKNLTIPAWQNTFAELNNLNVSKLLQDTLSALYLKQAGEIPV